MDSSFEGPGFRFGWAHHGSQAMCGFSSWSRGGIAAPGHEGNCSFTVATCPSESCMIHGHRKAIDFLTLFPHRVGIYDPVNPTKLCDLENCPVHRLPVRISSVPKELVLQAEEEAKREKEEEARATILENSRRNDYSSAQHPSPSSFLASMAPRGVENINHPAGHHGVSIVTPSRPYLPPSKDDEMPELLFDSDMGHGGGIFDNDEEWLEALSIHNSQLPRPMRNSAPLMFTYGISYNPQPYSTSNPRSRTVFIIGISPSVPIRDIMPKVRGGKVLNVTTATSPQPFGHTVLIEFTESHNARSYAEYMKENASSLFGSGVEVKPVDSPSYPLAIDTQKDLLNGFTRLLVFHDFEGDSSNHFLDDFKTQFGDPEKYLEDTWVDSKNVLHILFKRVAFASHYYKTVARYMKYADSIADDSHRFAPDPCDKPLSDLRGPALWPARGLYRSLLEPWIKKKSQEAASSSHYDTGLFAAHERRYFEDQLSTVAHASSSTADKQDYQYESEDETQQEPLAEAVCLITFEGMDDPQASTTPRIVPDTCVNTVHILDQPIPEETPADEKNPFGGPKANAEDDSVMIPKYLLPQTDVAFQELLNRDGSDLVRRSEAERIFRMYPFSTMTMEERNGPTAGPYTILRAQNSEETEGRSYTWEPLPAIGQDEESDSDPW